MNRLSVILASTALGAAALALSAPMASAQYQQPETFDAPNNRDVLAQQEAKDVSYLRIAQVGTDVPLDLTFTDETGKQVKLGDYFDGTTPVILQIGYYKCPQLCDLISQGIATSVKNLTLKDGEFRILMVSFDPNETYKLAEQKKVSTLDEAGKPGLADDWHFLVGTQPNIDRLTKAVGFGYGWVDIAQQWSHPSGAFILSPSGKLTRILPGTNYDPETMRLSLVEASDGQVGSFIDSAILTCFSYDAGAGKYTWAAVRLMQGAGLLTIIVFAVGLSYFFFREKRTARDDNDNQAVEPATA